MKLASVPLTVWANRGVTANQLRVAEIVPELRMIREKYRGEEQAERILALYKEANYNPYLELKSSLVLLVQIPIFIWVFLGVSSSEKVRGEQFWLVEDLSGADGLVSVGPFTLNVLPVIMLLVAIGNLLHLSHLKNFGKNQMILGWAISLGFFVLLYGSPAASVIYWTISIIFQWLIDVWIHFRASRAGGLQ